MAEVQPTDVLFIPMRRRMTHAMLKSPEGQEILHIFYGEKEIIFDEPDLLPFGNRLLEVERFRADEATTWSSEAPYDWERVRGLLETLLSEQILKHFDNAPAPKAVRTFPSTLGRCPMGRQPQTYSAHKDECSEITIRTLGRSIDLGNLEVVLPVHRVGHPAVDRDGRQVGENNVDDRLFLDLPTDRRLCNYAGTRYHADAGINQTALKHMTKRWPELLSLTEQYRTAFFERLPREKEALQAGEVHLLAVTTLGLVGYVMVRGVDPVPNGELDGGLAAMFRLIDGVRIVTTQMLRDTAGVHSCDRAVNARAIADYAERNSLYNDKWGVCAGPQVLIDEYLRVLLEGDSAPIQVQPDIAARVGDLAAAIDYGLHGLRQEAIVRSFGALQGFLHERLRVVFEQHGANVPRTKLQALSEIPIDREHFEFLRIEHPLHETLEMELRVSRWLFNRARQGLPKDLPGILDDLDEIKRFDVASRTASEHKLNEFFTAVVADYLLWPEPIQREVVKVAAEFFALERTCVRAVTKEQQRLNHRLKRAPGRPLIGEDLTAYARRCTHALVRELADGLGLSIRTDVAGTVLAHGDKTLSFTD